mgnify:CR=1 FL=1
MARALKNLRDKTQWIVNKHGVQICEIFFWNSCANLFQFQNIYGMNKRRCPSVLYTKEESTRFAGASINLSGRHANNSHGAKLTTQFVTSRICSLWRWFWRKYKRECYLQTSALIFSKIALRTDIRAQNDLCVDQLETSTSSPGKSPGIWTFKDWIVQILAPSGQKSVQMTYPMIEFVHQGPWSATVVFYEARIVGGSSWNVLQLV